MLIFLYHYLMLIFNHNEFALKTISHPASSNGSLGSEFICYNYLTILNKITI